MSLVLGMVQAIKYSEFTFLDLIYKNAMVLQRNRLTMIAKHAGEVDIISMLDSLSPGRKNIFLGAPETWFLTGSYMKKQDRISLNRLLYLLSIESYLSSEGDRELKLKGALESEKRFDTALGDFSINSRKHSITSNGFSVNGIWLDFDSYRSSFDHDLGATQLDVQCQNSYSSSLILKMKVALEDIEIFSPKFYSMVKLYVKSIAFQFAPQLKTFHSGSRKEYPGKVAVLNAQLATEVEMTEAVIHEAIHSILYKIELFEEFYLVDPSRVHMQSPWTNRKLRLHSFTHACFVWFALNCFAKKEVLENTTSARYHELLKRSSVGFGEDLTAGLDGVVDYTVVDTIRKMQDYVKGEMIC